MRRWDSSNVRVEGRGSRVSSIGSTLVDGFLREPVGTSNPGNHEFYGFSMFFFTKKQVVSLFVCECVLNHGFS